MRPRTEPRIGTKVYVKETGDVGTVSAHYFQNTLAGLRVHSVLVLLDNKEYGTYSPNELTGDIHLVTRVTEPDPAQLPEPMIAEEKQEEENHEHQDRDD